MKAGFYTFLKAKIKLTTNAIPGGSNRKPIIDTKGMPKIKKVLYEKMRELLSKQDDTLGCTWYGTGYNFAEETLSAFWEFVNERG